MHLRNVVASVENTPYCNWPSRRGWKLEGVKLDVNRRDDSFSARYEFLAGLQIAGRSEGSLYVTTVRHGVHCIVFDDKYIYNPSPGCRTAMPIGRKAAAELQLTRFSVGKIYKLCSYV
jgi:hypothetical protein